MRIPVLWIGFFLFLHLFVTAGAWAGTAPESFSPLVEKLSPAVVNVYTTQKIKGGQPFFLPFGNMPGGEQPEEFKEFFEHFGMPFGDMDGMEQEVQSLGSGFVISSDGYIVSNNHVIESADEISVKFQDGKTFEAKVIGHDSKTDLALLKIEADENLPYVTFGDSDEVKVGDWVLAIGNPYGLGGTVTAGIISARSRNINSGPFDDFLQTDAAINRGNSGGPMFNTDGEVIGINTAIFSPTGGNVGIGFATPTSLAQPVIKQLKEHGRTFRGWLGVKIQHVTEEIADSVGLRSPSGALVLEVNKGSPAEEGGVNAGDVIVEFDGKPIKEMRFLPRIVAETEIGKSVRIVVWREGGRKTLNVELGELEEEDTARAEQSSENAGSDAEGEKFLGMTVAPLDEKLRKSWSVGKETEGIVIVGVERAGEASRRGLRAGDVITSVNQKNVTSVESLKQAFKDAQEDGKKYALVRIWRKGDASFVTLPTQETK